MCSAVQVCAEFLDLRIPRHAEILDVAAGSGILSAELQTGRYRLLLQSHISLHLLLLHLT